MIGLLLVLALLLPVLALLQYRWIGTLSQGEQVRMRRALYASAMRFSDDLNKILEQAHLAFQIAPSRNAEPLATWLSATYKTWQATAPYPDLIAAIYFVRSDTVNGPRLARFDAGQNSVTEASWPDSLAPWRAYFSSTNAVQNEIPDASVDEGALPANPPGMPIPLIAPFDAEAGPPTPEAPDHVLLILDATVFANTILPTLTATHFSEDNTLAYDVLIQSRTEPQHLVYRSAPDQTVFTTPDLATTIGHFRWTHVITYATDETVGRYVSILHRDSSLAAMAVRLIDQGLADDQTAFLDPTFVDRDRREALRRPASDPPGTALQIEAARETEAGSRAPDTSSTGKVWTLRVQHRAGSIEAAVTGMRRRNLAVSFGILLLLGLAGGLLYLSSQRARRLAEQQTAFVAGVSHELRTPLAVIRSAAENLADGLVENPEQARRYGQLIHAEGRRLSDIVEQTLALAGIQRQQATLNLQPVALAPLLRRALDRCRPGLGESETEVTLDVASGLPPVQADALALEAAICNLISNALKYGDGWMHLDAQHVANGQTSEVQITVRDRGAGIPAHEQPHLFEPFYRGAAARAAQIRGSGLGLSLVKQTVEAHGGHVSVKSAAGQGSAFTIHLPVASP